MATESSSTAERFSSMADYRALSTETTERDQRSPSSSSVISTAVDRALPMETPPVRDLSPVHGKVLAMRFEWTCRPTDPPYSRKVTST